jgi:hypothetical protein
LGFGLHISDTLFDGQKRFFREHFSENSDFMYGHFSKAVFDQEWVMKYEVYHF